MAFYVGDIPAEDLVVEPARNGEALDLSPFDAVEVELFDPTGTLVVSSGFIATLDYEAETVTIEWPGESVFEAPGLYIMALTLTATEGFRERLAPLPLVAQEEDGWQTIDSARAEWITGAPDDDAHLFRLLDAAKDQCIQFAPALNLGQRPPARYADAQLMQARNIFNSMKTDPSITNDGELFILRPYPMDKTVKLLLRPIQGRPAIH
jgi:hypothetical protein